MIRRILVDNPDANLPDDLPPEAELPPGLVLRIADREPTEIDPLYWHFNLSSDPTETRDLATGALPGNSPLLQLMLSIAEDNLARAVEGHSVPLSQIDPETVEALRALGYVDG
jgi:hypothetical protein